MNKNNHARSFTIKCLNNLLPTCDWLHKRKPLLYEDALCKLCATEIEFMTHLASCAKLQQLWTEVKIECVNKMVLLMSTTFSEEDCSRIMINNLFFPTHRSNQD